MRILWLDSGTHDYSPVRGPARRSLEILRRVSAAHEVTRVRGPHRPVAQKASKDVALGRELVDTPLAPLEWSRPGAWFRHVARLARVGAPDAPGRAHPERTRAVRKLLFMAGYDLVIVDGVDAHPDVPGPLPMPSVLLLHEPSELADTAWWDPRTGARRHAWVGGVCRTYDHVFAMSDVLARSAERAHDLQGVGVIAPAVDAEAFAAPGSAGEAPPALAYVGDLGAKRNQEAVLGFAQDVWPRIRSQMPEAELHLIGPGAPTRIQGLCQRPNGIVLAGSREDVRPFLWGARAFILPHGEALDPRLAALEALAAGRPVLAAPDVLATSGLDEVAGTVPVPDNGGWVGQALNLLRNADYAGSLGRRAGAAAPHFTWDRAVAPLLALLARARDPRLRPRSPLALRGRPERRTPDRNEGRRIAGRGDAGI